MEPVQVREDFLFKNNEEYNAFVRFSKLINVKTTLVRQTILPLFVSSLIELLGDDKSLRYEAFEWKPIMDEKSANVKFVVNIRIATQDFIGQEVSKEAIESDQGFLTQKLQTINDITINYCKIDTDKGNVSLNVTV